MTQPVGASLKSGSPEPEENDYETQGNLDTLVKAHGIIHHPAKMAKVHALAGRHSSAIKAIKSTQDLKDLYDKKYGKTKVQENPLAVHDDDTTSGDDGN
jgi:hypothetical protein